MDTLIVFRDALDGEDILVFRNSTFQVPRKGETVIMNSEPNELSVCYKVLKVEWFYLHKKIEGAPAYVSHSVVLEVERC